MRSTVHTRLAAGSVTVISPHFDDGVFSCGDLLAARPGSRVITVCSGLPADPLLLTEWDRRCGFTSAIQSMRTRHEEDRRACALLDCEGQALGLRDSQYATAPQATGEVLACALELALREARCPSVLLPLGLFHHDHVRVSDAVLALAPTFSCVAWILYEDVPYRARAGAVQERVTDLMRRGLTLTPLAGVRRADAKRRAISAYASQLRGLGGVPRDVAEPERYWSVSSRARTDPASPPRPRRRPAPGTAVAADGTPFRRSS